MFWNIAHMKRASFHTHTHISSCHCPLCLMQLGPRVACHVVKYLKFMCYIRHLFSSFFYHCLAFQLLCVGVAEGWGGGHEYANQNTRGKCLALLGKYPFALSVPSWQLIFIVNPLGFFAFFAIVVFRESLFTLKRIACVCVCVYL